MDNTKLPAYPRTHSDMGPEEYNANAGFTKLELASLMAMQGILGNSFMMKTLAQSDYTAVKSVALSSVDYAKAVL